MGKEKKIRVMIVDDAPFMRGMIRYFLSEGGYEVCGEAGTGAAAIQLFKEVAPDLVVMDIIMPDMGGVEAVKEIRKSNSGVKILMLSAVSNKPVVSLAIETGANDFLPKPFKRDMFLKKVGEVMKSP